MSATIANSFSNITALSYRLNAPIRSQLSATKQSAHRLSRPPVACRPIHQSTRLFYPAKDSQGKDDIRVEPNEYSKSGSDVQGSQQPDAAFNPDITDPQQQKDVAGKNKGDVNNPLEVSPANPEVSKPRDENEGGAENSSASSHTTSDRQRSSGGGSPAKGKSVS